MSPPIKVNTYCTWRTIQIEVFSMFNVEFWGGKHLKNDSAQVQGRAKRFLLGCVLRIGVHVTFLAILWHVLKKILSNKYGKSNAIFVFVELYHLLSSLCLDLIWHFNLLEFTYALLQIVHLYLLGFNSFSLTCITAMWSFKDCFVLTLVPHILHA